MPDARLDLLSEMTVDGLPVDDLKRQEQLLKRMTLPEAKACIRNWLDYDRMFLLSWEMRHPSWTGFEKVDWVK